MIKNQARLFRRNHTYYIRVSIPNDLKNIIKNREIKYSLKTNDYFESLKLLRRESANDKSVDNFPTYLYYSASWTGIRHL